MRDLPLLSLRVRPVTILELMLLRLLSRLHSDGDAMFRSVLRVRFLRSSIGSGWGWRAERGMAAAESCLLMLLAARPAATLEEVRRKALLVRDVLGEDSQGNADAMFVAAIEADLARLGHVAGGCADAREGVALH